MRKTTFAQRTTVQSRAQAGVFRPRCHSKLMASSQRLLCAIERCPRSTECVCSIKASAPLKTTNSADTPTRIEGNADWPFPRSDFLLLLSSSDSSWRARQRAWNITCVRRLDSHVNVFFHGAICSAETGLQQQPADACIRSQSLQFPVRPEKSTL